MAVAGRVRRADPVAGGRQELHRGLRNRGADRAAEFDELEETTELLAPAPYDALYPHYLCGQMDAALGEADRAANELAQYNSLLSGFAAWMRRTYMPAKKPRIVW